MAQWNLKQKGREIDAQRLIKLNKDRQEEENSRREKEFQGEGRYGEATRTSQASSEALKQGMQGRHLLTASETREGHYLEGCF